jgi:3-oxoacyl-[acyl-carrier-protein] synthase-1
VRPPPLFINDCGIVTALGCGKEQVAGALFSGHRGAIVLRDDLVPGQSVYVGAVSGDLPALSPALADYDCRNNRLMQVALAEIASAVDKALTRYGRNRVAVVLGTSTSGMAEGEAALAGQRKSGLWPEKFHYQQQEIGGISAFAAHYFGLTALSYTIGTACSSSAKVFASARRLINAGIADAVIVGGADTLCGMTLNGFNSLGLLSPEKCNPFSVNRKGITIGEGASAFLVSRDESSVQLLGIGETSDAYHTTAPDPVGAGARKAMLQALSDAELNPDDISYINLHGTATPLNDAMEATAVASVFGSRIPCGSSKGMTGHMLGATGGCEAGFLWLALNLAANPGRLPPHAWDGRVDPALPTLNFVTPDTLLPQRTRLAMLSNSFGFGGSNTSLIFGRSI